MEQYDILYVHATKYPNSEDQTRYGIMPMGIIAILNQLRSKGISVLGLNLAIEYELDPNFDFANALADIEYKIFMTDLHWYEHCYGATYVAEQSKKVHPQVPVVIGGYTSTLYANEILENFSAIDYVVTGDSDLPMERLTDCLLGRTDTVPEQIPNLFYRDGKRIVAPGITWVQTTLDELDCTTTDFFRNADKIPYLSAAGVQKKTPSQWICIARGCKYNCAYCCGANANMKTLFRRCNILTRSPEKVVRDFLVLEEKGISVSPSHDLQMFGTAYYKAVFEGIRKTGVKPGMYLECFQLPTKEFVDEVAATFDLSRLILEISPISGNEQLRKENGKHFSNDDFYEIVRYILDKGIKVMLYYTVNVVGETKEQFMDTLFQMKYLRTKYKLQDIYYQRVVIDPLAGMREWKGVHAEYNRFMDYYRYCQIPHAQRLTVTGFTDGGELPAEQKVKMFEALFR